MGYQFVMNVRIILINCNRNVNRTFVFLILLYWWGGGGVVQPLIFNISANFI